MLIISKRYFRLLLKSSTNSDSKKKNKHSKMSTLKEAKEADEDEEDAGITIKVMIDSLL